MVTRPSPTVRIGVGAHRLAQVDSLLQCADEKTSDDVDCCDQDGGERVALVEPRRAIHGAVEFSLAGDSLASAPRLRLIDRPGIHVRIDGHLLAR